MNIVETLQKALQNQDWQLVEKAYNQLGGTLTFTNMVNTYATPSKEIVDQESPKKRGRPKGSKNKKTLKEEDLVVTGNQVAKVLPAPGVNDDFTVVREHKNPEQPDGRREARLEPFRPPTGPNKFNPSITIEEVDRNYHKINDQIKPVQRTRPPVQSTVELFCNDCNKTVTVPVYSSLNKDTNRCEYAAAKQRHKCPYAK